MFQFNRNAEIRKGANKRAFTPKPKANIISFALFLGDLRVQGFMRDCDVLRETSSQCPLSILEQHGTWGQAGIRVKRPGVQSWVSTL